MDIRDILGANLGFRSVRDIPKKTCSNLGALGYAARRSVCYSKGYYAFRDSVSKVSMSSLEWCTTQTVGCQ